MIALVASCGAGEAALSDGGGSMAASERGAADFVSVLVEQPGRQFTVEAPGVFLLEDLEGMERVELTTDEYAQVLDIVLDPEFVEAIANPSRTREECHPIADGGFLTSVVWSDIGRQSTSWGYCMDENHPLARLVSLLIDLLKKYVDCPRVDLGVVAVRQLCNGCWALPLDSPGAC